jgi:sulfite exporter TauE/SafE
MQHFVVYAHLPVPAANRTTWRAFTAAHGAFLFFSRPAYDQAGGHAAVKQALVDDMALAQNIKSQDLKTLLVSPGAAVTCYMYTSSREAWLGFSKNIFPGIGRSAVIASAVIAVHTLFFILPAFLLLAAVAMAEWQLVIPYVLTVLLRAGVTIKASHPWWTVLVQPLSSGVMIAVLLYSIYLDKTKKGYSWKGRTYQ